MRIAICDDCREDAYTLRGYLGDYHVHIFSDPQELLHDLEHDDARYDLYLLDIYMESDLNGIELARQLRARDEEADICFISSSDEFYRDAYDIQDVNYLLKPVSEDAFRQLIERVHHRRVKRPHHSFHYRRKGQMETIPYHNILFFGSRGHLVEVYCKDGTSFPCGSKLDEVESVLDGGVFMRCHQSFLVNLYQIDHLSNGNLYLGSHRVPISRRYFVDVKRRYQDSLFEEVN